MASESDLATLRAFIAAGNDGGGGVPDETSDATERANVREVEADADAESSQDRQTARDINRADENRADRRARGDDGGGLFSPLNPLVHWVEDAPTPGGNLALVFLIVFLAFALIPVNAGRTRLQLIWLVLTNQATLPTFAQSLIYGLGQGMTAGVNDIFNGITGIFTGQTGQAGQAGQTAVTPSGGGGAPANTPYAAPASADLLAPSRIGG